MKSKMTEREIWIDGERAYSSVAFDDFVKNLTESSDEDDMLDMSEMLAPEPDKKGHYYTSPQVKNKWIDPRILIETQIKRFARWLSTTPPGLWHFFSFLFVTSLKMKLRYFDQGENEHFEDFFVPVEDVIILDVESESDEEEEEELELNEPPQEDEFSQLKITNRGHASQLVEISSMKVMIDPVFADLAPFLYPSMTKQSVPEQMVDTDLDVILISHNHRDHVDEETLRAYLAALEGAGKEQPTVLVPMGDKKFFDKLGFTKVEECEWNEVVPVKKEGKTVNFCSVPSNHRSGRGPFDIHKSLVTGWVMHPENSNEIVYDAGDTARLSESRITAIAVNIYQLVQQNEDDSFADIRITQLIPGGPNYTRKDMQPTHQSFLDSMVSGFRLAIALEKVSEKAGQKIDASVWLEKISNIVMHQNKFELGPDRFNENVFIRDRALSYLSMNDAELVVQREKQAGKSKHFSLFHRKKDFILDGVDELKELSSKIWGNQASNKLTPYIQSNYHFPKINETMDADEIFREGPTSHIPDTRHRCYLVAAPEGMSYKEAKKYTLKQMRMHRYAILKMGDSYYHVNKKTKEIESVGTLKKGLYSGAKEKLSGLSDCFKGLNSGEVRVATNAELTAISEVVPLHNRRKGEKARAIAP